jgi:hypothetical protein
MRRRTKPSPSKSANQPEPDQGPPWPIGARTRSAESLDSVGVKRDGSVEAELLVPAALADRVDVRAAFVLLVLEAGSGPWPPSVVEEGQRIRVVDP